MKLKIVPSHLSVSGTKVVSGASVTATGNVVGGNIVTAGQVTATGNIQGSYILGNGSFLTGVGNLSANLGYYGAFYDTTNQSIANISNVYEINIGTTSGNSGTYLSDGGNVNFQYGGTYNLQFSIQFINRRHVWLRNCIS